MADSPSSRRAAGRRKAPALGDSFTHRLHTLGKLTDRVTQAAYLDETALVTMPGGAQARVRNPLAAGQGDVVYVQDGAVIGQAPALPVVVIEI